MCGVCVQCGGLFGRARGVGRERWAVYSVLCGRRSYLYGQGRSSERELCLRGVQRCVCPCVVCRRGNFSNRVERACAFVSYYRIVQCRDRDYEKGGGVNLLIFLLKV